MQNGTVYYGNPKGSFIGPDSNPVIYNRLVEAAEVYGFKNYKIVYADHIVSYAYVIPGRDVVNFYAWQAAPIEDLKKICPETYEYLEEEEQLEFYKYVMWSPTPGEGVRYSNCGNQHYEIYFDDYVKESIAALWQLIPTDENGNDILELGSQSQVLLNSLHS